VARNPLKDTLAVVGVGSTAYGRDLKRSELSLGLDAALRAIDDAGIDRQEIDGICGTGMTPVAVGGAGFLTLQGALGIEKATWVKNGWLGSCFVYAAEAVFSGLCDTALVVQAYTRNLTMSRSAANDPFRMRAAELDAQAQSAFGVSDFARRWAHSGEPYAAWMGRYMHDYGATKTVFGRIAVNNRSHAVNNPSAAMRTPITLDDYAESRMIWEPMQLLDMDLPVDCGEALLITTAERARDLPRKPVYIHAMSLGGSRVGEFYENTLSWNENSSWKSLEGLWERSELHQRRRPDRGGGVLQARGGLGPVRVLLGHRQEHLAAAGAYLRQHQRRQPVARPGRRVQLLHRSGPPAARHRGRAAGARGQERLALRR